MSLLRDSQWFTGFRFSSNTSHNSCCAPVHVRQVYVRACTVVFLFPWASLCIWDFKACWGEVRKREREREQKIRMMYGSVVVFVVLHLVLLPCGVVLVWVSSVGFFLAHDEGKLHYLTPSAHYTLSASALMGTTSFVNLEINHSPFLLCQHVA